MVRYICPFNLTYRQTRGEPACVGVKERGRVGWGTGGQPKREREAE